MLRFLTNEQVDEKLAKDMSDFFMIVLVYNGGEKYWTKNHKFENPDNTLHSTERYNIWKKFDVLSEYKNAIRYYNLNLISTDQGSLEIIGIP